MNRITNYFQSVTDPSKHDQIDKFIKGIKRPTTLGNQIEIYFSRILQIYPIGIASRKKNGDAVCTNDTHENLHINMKLNKKSLMSAKKTDYVNHK